MATASLIIPAPLRPIVLAEMNPPLQPTLVTDEAGLRAVEKFIASSLGKATGLDLETNVVPNFYHRKIRTFQLGDRNEQYVIDLLKLAGSTEALEHAMGDFGARAKEVFGRLLEVVGEYVENRGWIKVGHNLEFEYETLRWCLGLRLHGVHDTLVAEKNIHAGLVHFMKPGFWGLEDVVARYTKLEMNKDLQKSFDLRTDLTQQQIEYCALDVRLPVAVRNVQVGVLVREGLTWPVQIDCDAIGAFSDMHLHGLPISEEKWLEKIRTNEDRIKQIITKLDQVFLPVVGSKHVGQEDYDVRDAAEKAWRDSPNKTEEDKAERKRLRFAFYELRRSIATRLKENKDYAGEAAINYRSQAQLRDALYKMGFNKRNLPNTDDGTLKKLSKYRNLTIKAAFKDGHLDYPVIDLLRLFRTVEKELSTYGYSWIRDHNYVNEAGKKEGGHLHPVTRRIHSRTNVLGAASGRTSSERPNCQNLPKEKEFRSSFEAPKGKRILTFDYAGCELRILAEESQDPLLINAFLNDWDVHSQVAELMYRDRWKDAALPDCAYYRNKKKCTCPGHEALRSPAKNMNFGIVNDMGPGRLSEEIDVTVDEAREMCVQHGKALPVGTEWLNKSAEYAQFELVARTRSGRRRRWLKPDQVSAKEAAIAEKKRKLGRNASPQQLIPSSDEIRRKYRGMYASIGREGRNHRIQGGNADLAKRAMYLIWLELEPKFGAYLVNMVHDELVIECPEETADACFEFVRTTMVMAGTEFVKTIPMEAEGHNETCWTK